MSARAIREGIHAVGAADWDRRLFDELIPLPDGTTYNSYLVQGRDRTVLLDTVDPTKEPDLFRHLRELNVSRIDYLVCHHAEQDHSGAIPRVLEQHPGCRVLASPKCKEILETHLAVKPERITAVPDAETLDLGGRTLEFIHAPWVHWPDTMFSYLKEDRVLFTGDFLGSHLASSELFVTDEPAVRRSAKRYFAEIMMPFRPNIRSHLDRIQGLAIDVICPSHGPVHDRPDSIIGAYRDWASDEVRNEVLIPFVSMHGSVRAMVDHFTEALSRRSVRALPFNLTRTDVGELAMALVDAATVVVGTPTVLVGLHPAAVHAVFLVNALRPKTRFVSLIGSYGWAGKMPEAIKGLLPNLKAVFLDPVVVRGYPRAEDLAALERLADAIRDQHRAAGAR